MTQQNLISIRNLSKSFKSNGKTVTVFQDLSFDIEIGKTLCILAPNGAGKSTVMNVVLGLLKQDSGEVVFPNNTKPKISYLMQHYTESLLPWKDLWQNIAFPLEFEGIEESERMRRVSEMVGRFGFEIPKRYPYLCSGGEKQRACLLRCFVNRPEVLLMDEPFSALDYLGKIAMENHLLRILEENENLTAVVVTHDPDQAIVLGDRVLILSKKPAKIIDDINIMLKKHPLDIADPEYTKIRARILASFRSGADDEQK